MRGRASLPFGHRVNHTRPRYNSPRKRVHLINATEGTDDAVHTTPNAPSSNTARMIVDEVSTPVLVFPDPQLVRVEEQHELLPTPFVVPLTPPPAPCNDKCCCSFCSPEPPVTVRSGVGSRTGSPQWPHISDMGLFTSSYHESSTMVSVTSKHLEDALNSAVQAALSFQAISGYRFDVNHISLLDKLLEVRQSARNVEDIHC